MSDRSGIKPPANSDDILQSIDEDLVSISSSEEPKSSDEPKQDSSTTAEDCSKSDN